MKMKSNVVIKMGFFDKLNNNIIFLTFKYFKRKNLWVVTDNVTVDKFHRYRLYTHKYSIFVTGVSWDSAKRMLFKSTILFAWWRQLKLTGVFDADFAKDVRCTWITSRENHRCRSVAEQCLDDCWCSSAGSGAVPCRRCGRVSLNRFCFSFDISVKMHNFPALFAVTFATVNAMSAQTAYCVWIECCQKRHILHFSNFVENEYF